ncbi:MAG: protein phosphatase 2C domain-containing protein [Pseudomonadota bacterium]
MTARPIRYAARTHPGNVRPRNEDSVLPLPDARVFVLADGMGGHEGGEFASQTVISRIAAIPPTLEAGEQLRAMRTAIQDAHAEISQEADRRGTTMGTTVVALILTEAHFACLWVGDSRLYLLRDGQTDQLTEDHSLVAEMVRAGKIRPEEAEHHPRANVITRAVGVGEALEIDKIRGEIRAGDRFLLCSDGLSRYAGEARLTGFMTGPALDAVAETLIEFALSSGGEDNVSVIAVEIG